MNYTMKAGRLYHQGKVAACIKGVFARTEKQIFSPEGKLLLHVDIRNLDAPKGRQGDVRFQEYIITNDENESFAIAKPDYAEGDDPMIVGWPYCRMPRVDHAQVQIGNSTYLLAMINSQNYLLKEHLGEQVMEMFHRGLSGGWDIEAVDKLSPELICGIFIFCRYIERENEFFIV